MSPPTPPPEPRAPIREPEAQPDVAAALSAHDATVEGLRSSGWRDYWWRTWGARGLLHVWSESAGPAVVDGLADPHRRPAEMCLKVAARREIVEAAGLALERMVERLDLPGEGLP